VAEIYVVVVEHNFVTAVRKLPSDAAVSVPESRLEIGTELATNYRARGCIDGSYHFDSAQRARVFATLCLEFIRALVDKRLDALGRLPAGCEYPPPGQPTDPTT
jgi:hypothetical protein